MGAEVRHLCAPIENRLPASVQIGRKRAVCIFLEGSWVPPTG
jgi:hypothetical protein